MDGVAWLRVAHFTYQKLAQSVALTSLREDSVGLVGVHPVSHAIVVMDTTVDIDPPSVEDSGPALVATRFNRSHVYLVVVADAFLRWA